MKKSISLLLAVIITINLWISNTLPISAEESSAIDSITISGTGYTSYGFLSDGNINKYHASSGNAVLTLESTTPICSLYILFNLEYGAYTITDNITGTIQTAGEYGFLHDYVVLSSPTTSLTIKFENGVVRLSEIQAFTSPTPNEGVQQWDPPLEDKADMVLFATHGDDDQLFFAGILPYYAKERNCGVQVVYLTDHRNLTYERTHEILNGLWSVGVTAYPVFGSFDDFRIDDLQKSYAYYENVGISQDVLQGFVVENIRRFKPQVAIGHDINGEYGHGMHMVYTDLLIKALDISGDETAFAESAEKYGTWIVPKTYLHLYAENPVVLVLDQPLSSFGGMTAFEVTQKLGYPCHKSQQYTWFTKWINWVDMKVNGTPVTRADQISKYSPCHYGLYRSTVGEDIQKNDFMENIVTYAEQERLEQERREKERLEQERLEQERLEKERREKEKLEKQRLEKEQQEKEKKLLIKVLVSIGITVALLVVILLLSLKNRRRKRRHSKRKYRRLP